MCVDHGLLRTVALMMLGRTGPPAPGKKDLKTRKGTRNRRRGGRGGEGARGRRRRKSRFFISLQGVGGRWGGKAARQTQGDPEYAFSV
jgi:hypothetical protein